MTFELIRRVTGYVALASLLICWGTLLTQNVPRLRKGTRDQTVRTKILLVQVAAAVLSIAFVIEVHFLAAEWWHIVLAAALGIPAAWALRRIYRRLVAAPRHRLSLRNRVSRFDFRVSRGEHSR